MPFLKMSEECALGIEALRASHMREVALVNLLYASILSGATEREARGVVLALLRQTRSRFGEELRLMRRVHYPKWQRHQKDHERIMRLLAREWRAIDLSNKTGAAAAALETMRYGAHLFRIHMASEDSAFADFIEPSRHAKARHHRPPAWSAPLTESFRARA